jgi:hypothetical protein
MNRIRQDPAEQRAHLRCYYRNWRPTRFGRLLNQVWAWVCAHGLTPESWVTLQVKSRINGRMCSTILVSTSHDGSRYVVSMLGDNSEWVKNVRAAGGKAFIKRRRLNAVRLTEIPTGTRAEVLKAWCQVGKRPAASPGCPRRTYICF